MHFTSIVLFRNNIIDSNHVKIAQSGVHKLHACSTYKNNVTINSRKVSDFKLSQTN